MKIRNIVFSGFMASILMAGGAYAAEGSTPVLATQSYADSIAAYAKGLVNTEVTNRNTAITAAINDLDTTVSQTATTGGDGLSLSITEADGMITEISGSIATNTYDKYGDAAQALADAKAYADDQDAAKIGNLGAAANVKAYVDSAIEGVTGNATSLSGKVDGIDGRLTTAEGKITTLNGNASTEGSVAYAVAAEATARDAAISTAVAAEAERAAGVEADLQSAIDTINNGTNGILAQAQGYTDDKISAEVTRANAAYDAIGAAADVQGDTTKTVADNATAISGLNASVSTLKSCEGLCYVGPNGTVVPVETTGDDYSAEQPQSLTNTDLRGWEFPPTDVG